MIKSIGKSEHGCCDHKTNTTCCAEMRKIFVLGRGGGWLFCRWGGLGLGRRRRNGGGECRQSGHIFTFADGLTDGLTDGLYSVGESVGKTVGNSDGQSTRHRTDLLFKSLGDSVGIFNGAPVTSPVRIWHFKSIGDSVGDSVGKITRQNLRATARPFFIDSEFSVGKYRRT